MSHCVLKLGVRLDLKVMDRLVHVCMCVGRECFNTKQTMVVENISTTKKKPSRVLWLIPVITAPRRLRQEDQA